MASNAKGAPKERKRAVKFEKYHGIGNDYLVYDCQKNTEELDADKIRKICDRNFGVGSDGILAGPYIEDGDFAVRVFNPDGSEAKRAGNGIRIFVKIFKRRGIYPQRAAEYQNKRRKCAGALPQRRRHKDPGGYGKTVLSSKDAGLVGRQGRHSEKKWYSDRRSMTVPVSLWAIHIV